LYVKIIVRIHKSTITSFIHIFLTPYAVNMQWAAWCYVHVKFIPCPCKIYPKSQPIYSQIYACQRGNWEHLFLNCTL